MDGWYHQCTGHERGQIREMVRDREAQCAAVRGVTKSWTRLGTASEIISCIRHCVGPKVPKNLKILLFNQQINLFYCNYLGIWKAILCPNHLSFMRICCHWALSFHTSHHLNWALSFHTSHHLTHQVAFQGSRSACSDSPWCSTSLVFPNISLGFCLVPVSPPIDKSGLGYQSTSFLP